MALGRHLPSPYREEAVAERVKGFRQTELERIRSMERLMDKWTGSSRVYSFEAIAACEDELARARRTMASLEAKSYPPTGL